MFNNYPTNNFNSDVNPRRKEPNYAARRVGAFIFTAIALAGAVKGYNTLNSKRESFIPDQTPSIVMPGSTLWDVASDACPARDPRPIISWILSQNPEIENVRSILPGTEVIVPTMESCS